MKSTLQPKKCRHCANVGRMRIAGLVIDPHDELARNTGLFERFFEVTVCPACAGPTVRSGVREKGSGLLLKCLSECLYPQSQTAVRGLPEAVSVEVNYARKANSPNGVALHHRRTLEAVCQDKNASGNTLYLKLEDLVSRDVVPANLKGAVDAARKFGNAGVHVGRDVSDDELKLLAALTRAVLEYVYGAPSLVEEADALIDKLARAREGGKRTPTT